MKSILRILLLILFFGLLASIFSYPLAININNALPYTHAPVKGFLKAPLMQGDHLSLYYIYWLIKDYFITPGQHLFSDPYMFNVTGYPQIYEPRGLPSSLLFFLFSFFGNIPAYNCMIILSFILCGICAFLLADKYFKNTAASILSAVIFTISPFRLAQLFGGHPTGFILFWIPLIIYLYELLWERKNHIYGWLAGICIFLMCMEEHHMGYYTALFSAAFWLYKFLFCNKKHKVNIFQFIKILLPVGIGWLASALYMYHVKTVIINISIAGEGRTFDEIKLYAPSIKYFFRRMNTDSEKYIYIGLVPFILTVLLLVKKLSLFIKNKSKKDEFPYGFYIILFFISLLLTLGPSLKYFPLYKLCYKIIPFFDFPRSPARIYMYVLLSLSLLSGYAVKQIFDRFKKTYLINPIFILIIFLLCLDYHPFPRIGLTTIPAGNKTYDYVKNSAPKYSLLELPLWPGDSSWSSIYQYYATIYRIPLVNGYSACATKQYINDIFWPLASVNMGMINQRQYELLKKLKIKYINLHEEAYPQKVSPFPFKITLENLKRSPYVKFVMNDGPVSLFSVLDAPSGSFVNNYTIPSKTGVFYECENMPHRIGKTLKDKDASGNTALYAEGIFNEPQHLVFGPWQLFPPGKYKILFRIKGKDSKIAVEVSTDKGKKQIVHKEISELSRIYSDYILHFTLEELTDLEFRIIYYGGGQIWADYIYLLCEEENDPLWHYKAADLFHIGREKEGAVYADPKIDPPGLLVFGPYRIYMPGRYKAGFNIKAGGFSIQNSAKIIIAGAYSEPILASLPLTEIPLDYKTYWLEFYLDKPACLEFKVEFLKQAPVYVDSIEVKPVS